MDDQGSVDILWFRLAGKNPHWLAVPVVLTALAGILALVATRPSRGASSFKAMRPSSETVSD
jgi:hypothetical protein